MSLATQLVRRRLKVARLEHHMVAPSGAPFQFVMFFRGDVLRFEIREHEGTYLGTIQYPAPVEEFSTVGSFDGCMCAFDHWLEVWGIPIKPALVRVFEESCL